MNKKSKADVVIQVRITRNNLKMIDQACKTLGITRSAFIRHAADVQAQRIKMWMR